MNRLALVALALTLPGLAWAGLSTEGKPKIVFNATGSPGFLDIEGVSNTVTVADDGTNLTFTVPMKTVTTGIELRDEHMNDEYVQVATYPNAVLSLARAGVTWPAAAGQKSSGKVAGDFNIHGKSQPVTVSYTAVKTAHGFRVSAGFDFDTDKASISIPSYLGVTIDPKMHADATLDLAGQ